MRQLLLRKFFNFVSLLNDTKQVDYVAHKSFISESNLFFCKASLALYRVAAKSAKLLIQRVTIEHAAGN